MNANGQQREQNTWEKLIAQKQDNIARNGHLSLPTHIYLGKNYIK